MSEKRSILDSMKDEIKKSSKSFGQFFFLKNDGDRARIRFLHDLEDTIEVVSHQQWQGKSGGTMIVNHPCLSYYGFDCPNCDNPDVKDVKEFILQCWNYESKRVELFKFKAARTTPISAIAEIASEYESLTDMDIVVTRSGTGIETRYNTIPKPEKPFPMKKEAMKQMKSKEEIYKMLLESNNKFGPEIEDTFDVEDILADFMPEEKQKKAPSKKRPTNTRKPPKDDEYDDEYEEDDTEDDEEEYEPPKRKRPAQKRPTRKPAKRQRPIDDDEYDIDDLEDEELEDDEVPF